MSALIKTNAPVLDKAGIEQLYPDLFSALASLNNQIDADFAARFNQFIANLERDFFAEEQWLEHLEPRVQREHRAEHAELLGLLHHAQGRLLAGDLHLARKVVPMLSHWFTEHISGMDMVWASTLSCISPDAELVMRNAA